MQSPLTPATSEGAQGIFQKLQISKLEHSYEKDELCCGFLVKLFTKSRFTGFEYSFAVLKNLVLYYSRLFPS
jgi:hypothetical protein